MKKIPFLDLRVSNETERLELLNAVEKVLKHGQIVIGPEVFEFEQRIADFCGRKFGVGVNSGTEALFSCLRAFDIGPGDEVITTSLSWIATANAIALSGATPVFADIDDDLNISPQSVQRLITSNTKAILPVHYTGKICKMDELVSIAKENNLILIEDAAQAFGASYKNKNAGAFGDAACFSFNSMKVLASCGEAGIIVTDSEEIHENLQVLRYNGTINRETCVKPSLNGRLHTIQAAMLLKRLDRLQSLLNRRSEIAQYYDSRLAEVVKTPPLSMDGNDVFYTYTIQAERRDQLFNYLHEKGIETKIQHKTLMPEQPAYKDWTNGEWENASRLVKKILCIPANEKLSDADIEYVADCILEFYP